MKYKREKDDKVRSKKKAIEAAINLVGNTIEN